MENDTSTFAVVTGASAGIGKAIARELASRHYNLILNSLPNEGLKEYCTELENNFNILTHHFEVDLATQDGPDSLFEFVKKNQCRVSLLVNNAGIGFEGPIEVHTRKQIDNMILLNIRALTLLTSYFTPELKTHKKAYILNIGSFGCYVPNAFKSVYLATKSYIFYFTRAIDSELTGSSIKTCVIVPSAVRTNRIVNERIERNGFIARKSACSPEEVARIGIKKLLRGKKVILPGKLSNFFFNFGMLVPEGIILLATRRLFRNYKN